MTNALERLGKDGLSPLSEPLGATVEVCWQRLEPRRTQYKTYEIKFLKEKKKRKSEPWSKRKQIIFVRSWPKRICITSTTMTYLERMRGAFTAAPTREEPVNHIPHAAPTTDNPRPKATPKLAYP